MVKTSGNTNNIFNSTGMSIMHQNFQCLKNKLDELEVLFSHELRDIDILCCTEHWLNEKEITLFHIKNYKLASSFSRTKYKNGGSAIFVKATSNISHIEKRQTYYLNREKDFEHVVTEIKYSNYCFTVACIYRSPSGSLNTFLENLEILLHSLKNNNKPLILCGDFNIDFSENNKAASDFRSLIHSFNLIETIDSPTRITPTSQTCLDQIVIDNDFYPFSAENINMGISDHNATFLHIKLEANAEPKASNKSVRYKRSFNESNIEYFKSMLLKEDWSDVFNKTDVNEKSVEFINTVTHYFKIAFPIKKIILSNKMNKSKNWITKGIIISCKRKRQLHNICQYTNDLNLKLYYKTYCNILKKVIHQAKLNYNQDFILRAENKSKAIWDVVKRETGKKTDTAKVNIELLNNGSLINSPHKLAEVFNNYFANVTQTLEPAPTRNPQPTFQLTGIKSTIFLNPVTTEEVHKIMGNLKCSLASGIDEIPDAVIKACNHLLALPMTDICNLSLVTGKFPEIFKVAKVCPIFKKGVKQNIENYRPISLLSGFSKVLEKVMYNRLVSFLEYNNILSNSQFGFRKGKGINNAVISFIESILNAKNNKEQTVGLFLDLSKAFDMVNHEILIWKLQQFGIRGLAGNWFISYLSNREQVVQIGSVKSKSVPMPHGVPQGSILGPILFLLYINDLPLNITEGKTVLFADDTNIILSDNKEENLQMKINATSTKLDKWLANNKLKLNVNKTVYVSFNQYPTDQIHIVLNNTIIKEVECSKFLGIWIDSSLTWEKHIQHLTEKLSRLCYAFRVLAKISPMELLISVYFGYVHSILSYGIITWGSSPKVTQVLKLQKRILKIIKKVPIRTESIKIFRELKILPVPCIYILETVCFIHQNIDSFKTNSTYHEYNTRTSQNIHLNYHRLTRSLNSISHRGSNLYNKLPQKFKELNIRKLKKEVKNVLLTHMPFCTNEYLNLKF